TRVCAYDRSGYGWSDMGPLPRTSKRLVDELHRLLFKAKVPGPYILVGHSFGGYVARYYASVYPKEMAGLVLIESSHPEQVERLPQNKRNSKTQYPPHSRTYNVSHPVMHEHYPVQARANAYHLMSSWKYKFTQREEMLSLPHSAKEVQGAEPLPNIPLVVLTRGKRVWPNNDYGDEMEKIWMEMQDELALLNEGAIHLIAERSGHSIHLDQPEFVISALRVLLNNQGSTPSHSKQEGY
ncbi:MAG: pimeloyl-ACP methyl ester carboxylesterase, partial [Planctomycetota bacterium]